jgi:hypothetical protein
VVRRISVGLSTDDNQISRFKASKSDASVMQMVHVFPLGAVGNAIAFDCQSCVRIGPVNALKSSLDGDKLILLEVGVSVMRLQRYAEDHHSTYCCKDNSFFYVSSVLMSVTLSPPIGNAYKNRPSPSSEDGFTAL